MEHEHSGHSPESQETQPQLDFYDLVVASLRDLTGSTPREWQASETEGGFPMITVPVESREDRTRILSDLGRQLEAGGFHREQSNAAEVYTRGQETWIVVATNSAERSSMDLSVQRGTPPRHS